MIRSSAWTVQPYRLYQHAATCYQTDKPQSHKQPARLLDFRQVNNLTSGHKAEIYLLDGGCISNGVDGAIRAQHPAMLVCHNTPEMRLAALWEPVLHTQRPNSLTDPNVSRLPYMQRILLQPLLPFSIEKSLATTSERTLRVLTSVPRQRIAPPCVLQSPAFATVVSTSEICSSHDAQTTGVGFCSQPGIFSSHMKPSMKGLI